MNKKILGIGLTILVLGALVFTVGGSVFAQEETPEVETTELPAPVVTRYGRGFGPGNGTCDGSCDADGDGIPDQLRLRDGSGTGMQYGPGEGEGFGPGEGQGFGPGNGQGMGQGMGLRDGSCIDD
jgi:hypothetical protein